MKTLTLVFCLFGSAMCQHWALPHQVGDTPEVAAAKAAHLAALAKAHQQQPYSGPEDDGSYRPEHHQGNWDNDDGSNRADDRSWTPQAPHQASHSWAAQPQQWTQPQAQHAPQQHWDAPQKKWTGPIALPPGFDKNGAPLQVLDTPEVAAAKAHHFNLYAHGAHAASAAHSAPAHQPAPAYAPQGAHTYAAQPAPVWQH